MKRELLNFVTAAVICLTAWCIAREICRTMLARTAIEQGIGRLIKK